MGRAIQLCALASVRLLLRVGIKVADERLISLGYVRSSNIYVRGYLDLHAWSLRLRTQTEENHYVKAVFFVTRRILFSPLDKRNTCDQAKGLRISSARHIVELGRAMP